MGQFQHLLGLREHFPFVFIDASGPIEQVQTAIRAEFGDTKTKYEEFSSADTDAGRLLKAVMHVVKGEYAPRRRMLQS